MSHVGRPGSRPEFQFSYWAVAQSFMTTTALMGVSILAMRAIERYGKKTFTPLQKQGLGLLATTVYFTASTYAFPWHQKVPTKDPSPKKEDSPLPREISYAALTEMDEAFYRAIIEELTEIDHLTKEMKLGEETVHLRILQQDKGAALAFFRSKLPQPKLPDGPPSLEVLEEGVVVKSPRNRERVGLLPPAKDEDDDGFEVVTDPARPDPNMAVVPATYVAEVHGLNGSLMRERMFKTLMEQYLAILKGMGLDPKEKLGQLADSKRKTAQQTMLRDVLNYLITPGSENESCWSYAGYTGHEGRYLLLMDAHRKLILDYRGKENTYDREALTYGRALSEAWMRPEMQSFQESLVRAHFAEEAPPMTSKTVHQAFCERNKAVGIAPAEMKMSFVGSTIAKVGGAISLCDYFGKNPPNLRKVETWRNADGREKQIYYLRHSTPNQGTYAQQAPVDPIYRDFLKGVEGRGQGVLYAAHQRLGDYGCKFEQEGYRAQSIVDLEANHPNLLVLFQSVESDLFMDRTIKTFAYLKERLIASFAQMDGNKRNRLPKYLMNGATIHPAYEAEIKGIFNFVHQVFFGGRAELDPTLIDCYGGLSDPKKMTWESQTVIMLFYHFQREHLKHADLSQYGFPYNVSYVNTGCKDDFDRGFGQNMTSDRVHQTSLPREQIPAEDFEAMISSGQAPPIQSKGIPVIPYRVQPALQVSRVLADLKGDQLQLLREKTWNGFRLTGYDVRRHPEQSATIDHRS
ncbi:MAG: hypothetical protein H7A38_02745 [Chlamydiales bacterium]|nr:hypothetical protein [Chlamydiales bacterium]